MTEWLLQLQGFGSYVVIFLLLLAGAIGLPVPEDLPLIAAGVLIETARANLWIMAAVCYAGVVIGDMVIFSIGRKVGPALFQKPWFRKRFPHSKIRKVRYNLEKRSLLMILIARHLFYLRTVTFLTCGAVRMSTARFIAADALAALISMSVMLSLGYLASAHIDTVLAVMGRTKVVIFGLSLVIAAAAFWWWKRKSNVELKLDNCEPLPIAEAEDKRSSGNGSLRDP